MMPTLDERADRHLTDAVGRLAVARIRAWLGRDLLDWLAARGWRLSIAAGELCAVHLAHRAPDQPTRRVMVAATPGGYPKAVRADVLLGSDLGGEIVNGRTWPMALHEHQELRGVVIEALRHLGELYPGT
jgi:hypothetical protein